MITQCDDSSISLVYEYLNQNNNVSDLISLLTTNDEILNIKILFFVQKCQDSLNNSHIEQLLQQCGKMQEKHYPKIAYIIITYLKNTYQYYDQLIDNNSIPYYLYLLLNVYAQRQILQDRKLYAYNFAELLNTGQHISLVLQLIEYFFSYSPPQQYDSLIIVVQLLTSPNQIDEITQQCGNILETVYTQYISVINKDFQQFIDYNLEIFLQSLNMTVSAQRYVLTYQQIKQISNITMYIFTISINSNILVKEETMKQIITIFNMLVSHKSIKVFKMCIFFIQKWINQAKQNHNMLQSFRFDIFLDQLIYFTDKNNYNYVLSTEQKHKSNLSEIEQYMQYDLQLDSKNGAKEAYDDIEQLCKSICTDLVTIKGFQVQFLKYLFTKINCFIKQIDNDIKEIQESQVQAFISILQITKKYTAQYLFFNCDIMPLMDCLTISQNMLTHDQLISEYINYLNIIIAAILLNENKVQIQLLKNIFEFLIEQIGHNPIKSQNDNIQYKIAQLRISRCIEYIVQHKGIQLMYQRSEELENIYDLTQIQQLVQIISEKSQYTSQLLQQKYQNIILSIQQMFQIQIDQQSIKQIITNPLTNFLSRSIDQIIEIFYNPKDVKQSINDQLLLYHFNNIYINMFNFQLVNNEINELMLMLFEKLLIVQEQHYIVNQDLINNFCNYKVVNDNEQQSHRVLVSTIIEIYALIISADQNNITYLKEMSLNILNQHRLDIYLLKEIFDKTYESMVNWEGIAQQLYIFTIFQIKNLQFLFTDDFKAIFNQQITIQYEYDMLDLLKYIYDSLIYKAIGIILRCIQQYNVDPPIQDVIFIMDITLRSTRLCERFYRVFYSRNDLFEQHIEILYKLLQITQDLTIQHDIKEMYISILGEYFYQLIKTDDGRGKISQLIQGQPYYEYLIPELQSCNNPCAVTYVLKCAFMSE